MSLERGVVAIPRTADGRMAVVGGLSENGGKEEMVVGIHSEMLPVVGKDFPGGAADGQGLLVAMRRETFEEFGVDFEMDRFIRVIPEDVEVRQIRGGIEMAFAVTCFALSLAEADLEDLLGQGAVLLSDPSELRPRDQGILQLAEPYL